MAVEPLPTNAELDRYFAEARGWRVGPNIYGDDGHLWVLPHEDTSGAFRLGDWSPSTDLDLLLREVVPRVLERIESQAWCSHAAFKLWTTVLGHHAMIDAWRVDSEEIHATRQWKHPQLACDGDTEPARAAALACWRAWEALK